MTMYQCQGCDAQSGSPFTDGMCDDCWLCIHQEREHSIQTYISETVGV